MTQSDKILYTAKTRITGGRVKGAVRSSDGHLDIMLSSPGSGRPGTNPEQLFAAAWSTCFADAIGQAARMKRIVLPTSFTIDAEVDLCLDDTGYFIQTRLNASLPGLEREVAQPLLDMAHQICPYSKAIRGNVSVLVNLV
jgi:osmotically inducible protein OsmC